MSKCSQFCILVISIFTCFPGLASADEVMDAKKAVESMLADYRARWMEGSEEKVMGALSEDVQLFVPGTGVGRLDGKEAVRELWFPNTDVGYPIKGYEISGQDICVAGNLAVATGKSELDWETVEAGQVVDRKTSHSEYMTVLRNEQGQWRIFRQKYQMRE